jgi:hypothetical protein
MDERVDGPEVTVGQIADARVQQPPAQRPAPQCRGSGRQRPYIELIELICDPRTGQ